MLKALLVGGPAQRESPSSGDARRLPAPSASLPPLPPPAQAEFTVASAPSGAEVRVNGRLVGHTPFSGSLTPGAHQIELTLLGYQPKIFAPLLRSGSVGQTFRYELVPASQEFNATVNGFQDGLDDRRSLETWFNMLGGDYKQGALYWAAQRSLPHPGPCTGRGDDPQAWTAGCDAARQRLGPTDLRRKSEPAYKAGWNSFDGPIGSRPDTNR